MRKNSDSQSGIFNLRVLVAFALCSVGVLLAMLSLAATPPVETTPAGKANVAASSVPLAPSGPGWSIVNSPNASSAQYLQGVTCASATDCWAVGYDKGTGVQQTLIERWNGTAWATVTSANTSATANKAINEVSGTSESDCS